MVQNFIDNLYDKNTFSELDKYMISPKIGEFGDGLTIGYGACNTRLVYSAFVDDEIVDGAFSVIHGKKIVHVIELAVKNGSPFVYVIKNSGVRLEEGLESLSSFGIVLKAISNAKGKIPLICIIAGNCFGISSVLSQCFDFVYVTKNASCGFSIESVIKAEENITSNIDGYGKCDFLLKSGFASIVLEDDDISPVRKLISLLPDNNLTGCPDFNDEDEINVTFNDTLNDLAENTKLSAGQIIDLIRDKSLPFVKIYDDFSESSVFALGVIAGVVVGFVSFNQDAKLGEKDAKAVSKLINFCDSFRIPVVSFVSSDGILPKLSDEKNNVSEAISDLAYAYATSDIPKITVICGDIFGSPVSFLGSKSIGADYVIAWENAGLDFINPKAAIEIFNHDEIVSAANPDETRKKLLESYNRSPLLAASLGLVDDIIKPGETKQKVASCLFMLGGRN